MCGNNGQLPSLQVTQAHGLWTTLDLRLDASTHSQHTLFQKSWLVSNWTQTQGSRPQRNLLSSHGGSIFKSPGKTSAFSVQRKNGSKSFRVKITNYKLSKMNSPANGSNPLTRRGPLHRPAVKPQGPGPTGLRKVTRLGVHTACLGDRRHRPPGGGRRPAHAGALGSPGQLGPHCSHTQLLPRTQVPASISKKPWRIAQLS